jgi:hypothetical protein
MLIGGRKSKKSRMHKKQRTYKKRGGCGMSPLQPANYDGVGTIAAPAGDANFAGRPPFSTTQVGGGISYGYDNGADAGVYGGSYFPISKACMAATDPSRGGNNYMSGGKRRKSKKGKKSKKYGGSKRKSRSAKKYRQKGCSKKGGLFILA